MRQCQLILVCDLIAFGFLLDSTTKMDFQAPSPDRMFFWASTRNLASLNQQGSVNRRIGTQDGPDNSLEMMELWKLFKGY